MLRFGSSPNFESPTDADTNNVYMVTLKATVGSESATQEVTVTVTNVEEDGTVRLSPTAPRVDVAITASVTDLDRGVTGEKWQWSSSNTKSGTYTNIPGASSGSYTPEASDEGMYLRATASYTDGEGSGKSATSESTGMVAAAAAPVDSLLVEYDPNDDGTIEKVDMRRAVANFFGASPTLTKAEMRRLVGIYFS